MLGVDGFLGGVDCYAILCLLWLETLIKIENLMHSGRNEKKEKFKQCRTMPCYAQSTFTTCIIEFTCNLIKSKDEWWWKKFVFFNFSFIWSLPAFFLYCSVCCSFRSNGNMVFRFFFVVYSSFLSFLVLLKNKSGNGRFATELNVTVIILFMRSHE